MNVCFKNEQPQPQRYTAEDVYIGQGFLKNNVWYLHCGFDDDGFAVRALNLNNELIQNFHIGERVDEIRDVVDIVFEGPEPKQELPF